MDLVSYGEVAPTPWFCRLQILKGICHEASGMGSWGEFMGTTARFFCLLFPVLSCVKFGRTGRHGICKESPLFPAVLDASMASRADPSDCDYQEENRPRFDSPKTRSMTMSLGGFRNLPDRSIGSGLMQTGLLSTRSRFGCGSMRLEGESRNWNLSSNLSLVGQLEELKSRIPRRLPSPFALDEAIVLCMGRARSA